MLIERWLTAPRWVKYASLIAVNSAAIILMVCFVIQPQQAQIQASFLKNQRESKKIIQLRHRVVSLVSSTREAGRHIDATPHKQFSATELVHYSEGKLEKWLPESKPAMLEMLLTWEKLPFLFARLSGYRAIALKGFIVEPKGELLKLTMTLDFASEP